MMPKTRLRRADIVTSLLLIALGGAVIGGARHMPLGGVYGGVPIHWYTSPAFFPMLLGTLLILCAVGVLIRAFAAGGHQQLLGAIVRGLRSLPKNWAAHRIVAIWVLLFTYILCLALHPFGWSSRWFDQLPGTSLTSFLIEPEGANYVVSSFWFLALFMLAFYRPARAGWNGKRGLLIAATSILCSWGVGYLFTEHLYSPLPW